MLLDSYLSAYRQVFLFLFLSTFMSIIKLFPAFIRFRTSRSCLTPLSLNFDRIRVVPDPFAMRGGEAIELAWQRNAGTFPLRLDRRFYSNSFCSLPAACKT
jgi:hypothetical protein